MARSILSFGMFSPLAARMAVRRRGFVSGSAPPTRAAMVNSRITLVKILPRRASVAAFLCLIVAHLECPDMDKPSQEKWQEQSGRPCRHILTAPLKSGNRTPRFHGEMASGHGGNHELPRAKSGACNLIFFIGRIL